MDPTKVCRVKDWHISLFNHHAYFSLFACSTRTVLYVVQGSNVYSSTDLIVRIIRYLCMYRWCKQRNSRPWHGHTNIGDKGCEHSQQAQHNEQYNTREPEEPAEMTNQKIEKMKESQWRAILYRSKATFGPTQHSWRVLFLLPAARSRPFCGHCSLFILLLFRHVYMPSRRAFLPLH